MAPTSESEKEFCPRNGWVIELGEAKAAAKLKESRPDPKAHISRCSRARHKLRKWKRCKTTAELALGPGEADKKMLRRHQKDATNMLSIESNVKAPWI
jgi:hypothetical protein